MWDLMFAQQSLEFMARRFGLGGLIHLHATASADGRPLLAAHALVYAVQQAHLVIDYQGNTILVELNETNSPKYRAFVWVEDYRGFASFSLQPAGLSLPNTRNHNIVAVQSLLKATRYLMTVSPFADGHDKMQGLKAFQEALRTDILLVPLLESHMC